MKKMSHYFYLFTALSLLQVSAEAQQSELSADAAIPSSKQQGVRIGVVNTKKCLEDSKLGKQEQANFEKMKNQMQSTLQEKEKTLEEIESKLNDEDYMDSISTETELELKRKKRAISNEGRQLQGQYMEMLQHANMKIIQKLTEAIAKASQQVASESTGAGAIDVIMTDEACTYYMPSLDVSDRVIAKMDLLFDAEQKESVGAKKLPSGQ